MIGRTLAAVLIVALASTACAAGAPVASPAPSLADPAGEATRQVNRFFDLLRDRDVAGLGDFLSPAFTLQRADGSGAGRIDYLAVEPARITAYRITDLRANQSGPVLVARYLADVEGMVNTLPYAPGPAPRLSVFVWNGSDWQIVAHANFNPLSG